MLKTSKKSKVWALVIVCCAAAIVGGRLFFQQETPSSRSAHRSLHQTLAALPDRQKTTLQIGETELEVEVVNTAQSITQGLSGRTEIGADGMLFVFDSPRVPSFWMKEMRFDLDLIWIKDGMVSEITPLVPAPALGTPLDTLPLYKPQQVVDLVLEVPAGASAAKGIRVGAPVMVNYPVE